jgi:hypothetical protein
MGNRDDVLGIRILLKPCALMLENTEGTTGGLFHDPSSGVASSVFPRFQPGFRALNAADAVTGVKVPVQVDDPVGEAECELTLEALDVVKADEDTFEVVEADEDALDVVTEVLVFVESVVALELELPAPGRH